MKGSTQNAKSGTQNDIYDSKNYKYWIEVYNYHIMEWIPVDPITGELLTEKSEKILQKLDGQPAFFILGFYHIPLKNKTIRKAFWFGEIFAFDVSARYYSRWPKIELNRKMLGIAEFWDRIKWMLFMDPVTRKVSIFTCTKFLIIWSTWGMAKHSWLRGSHARGKEKGRYSWINPWIQKFPILCSSIIIKEIRSFLSQCPIYWPGV